MKGLVLLDTAVVLHVVRGNDTAKRIDAAMNLTTDKDFDALDGEFIQRVCFDSKDKAI